MKKGISDNVPSHIYNSEKKSWCKLKNKIDKTIPGGSSYFLSSLHQLPHLRRNNRTENKNSFCIVGFQIIFVVIFFFASQHIMHQDRSMTLFSEKNLLSGKRISYYETSPVHFLKKSDGNSDTNVLKNDGVFSTSRRKDITTEIDASFYSINEIFLLA